MKMPKDYIIFPLDVSTMEDAKRYVSILSGHVGLFKVGLELFINSGPDIVRMINDSGPTGVFLDLKLHDIPQTVLRAMKSVAKLGVKFATVHCGENIRMLEAAVEGAGGDVSVLGVTVLTSVTGEDIEGAGFDSTKITDMSKLVMLRAQMAHRAGCAGVVCSGLEVGTIKGHFGKDFVAVTPGIRPEWSLGKSDDQMRVTTPRQAVCKGSDFLVIGRPIRDADEPVAASKKIADEIQRGVTSPQMNL